MIKSNQISAVLLSLLLLASTSSFAVNLHYCGDHLMGLSLVKSEIACAMHNSHSTEKPDSCHIEKQDCCENVVIQNEKQVDLTTASTLQVHSQQFVFLGAFLTSYVQLLQPTQEKVDAVKFYTPPLLVNPIHKLDETYLI